MKRAWLNKIKEEAENSWGFPLLVGKFSGARQSGGVQKFVAMDIDDFVYMLNHISNLNRELELSYEKSK